VLLDEGHTVRLGVHELRALLCPGHARGSICYAVDGMLFSGDVLFKGSVGRVDVQNSSREDQIASVRRLYTEFPDDTVVYPGHGEPTTIGAERTGNERITETAVYLWIVTRAAVQLVCEPDELGCHVGCGGSLR
jgi:glyoxylase-like metal-dependent hydrolase (beta-lactamase superfamily II)